MTQTQVIRNSNGIEFFEAIEEPDHTAANAILELARRCGEFGDGSDGAGDYSAANLSASKSEYQFTTLTIGAGFSIAAPAWSALHCPIFTIRCQQPITLDGSITANAVSRTTDGSGVYLTTLDPSATMQPAQTTIIIYPIAGGGNATSSVYLTSSTNKLIGYSAVTITGNPATPRTAAAFADLIGPTKPFRYAAGTVGGRDNVGGSTSNGGAGGGCLIIYAPGIVFGANAVISANGGDAVAKSLTETDADFLATNGTTSIFTGTVSPTKAGAITAATLTVAGGADIGAFVEAGTPDGSLHLAATAVPTGGTVSGTILKASPYTFSITFTEIPEAADNFDLDFTYLVATDNGGGGGGYVEIHTKDVVATADKAKVTVTGGAGGPAGYAGLAGLKRFIVD